MNRSSDKLFVPHEWKRWIAENVLRGSDQAELVAILVEKGFGEELARLEVDAAACHPYVQAAQQLLKAKANQNAPPDSPSSSP